MLFNTSPADIQPIEAEWINEKQVSLSVLRLDKIHPVISGNKLFKLHYFLQKATESSAETIVTFGGAYSNHLVATAYVAKILGLQSIGVVRGEKPGKLSHSLAQCAENGMQLRYISREIYSQKQEDHFLQKIAEEFKGSIIIPEGGYQPIGAKGASLITALIDNSTTHICCAMGTATTVAGLLVGAADHQQVIGISVLKGMADISERIGHLTQDSLRLQQLTALNDYHFGGYAKKNTELFAFMNELHRQYQLPTDFVYTGKMMWGIFDLIKKGFFAKGSKITAVHTGGLQGNLSLAAGTLIF